MTSFPLYINIYQYYNYYIQVVDLMCPFQLLDVYEYEMAKRKKQTSQLDKKDYANQIVKTQK